MKKKDLWGNIQVSFCLWFKWQKVLKISDIMSRQKINYQRGNFRQGKDQNLVLTGGRGKQTPGRDWGGRVGGGGGYVG